MKVAVLGSGPAGLMAAHAAVNAHALQGVPDDLFLDIYARGDKSPLYGAQFLHAAIPGMTPAEEPAVVDYHLVGDPADYRRKVYGRQWVGSVSPQQFGGLVRAWDIRATYDALWGLYSRYINAVDLEPNDVAEIVHGGFYDIVINSIPLPDLCHKGHHFGATEIIAAGDAPDLGIDIGKTFRCSENTVICNGNPNPSWYRISNIFGHTTVEWPASIENVPVRTASRVRKPLDHDCDCWPTILKVGRFGSWTKGVLSHHAFMDAHNKVLMMLKEA